MARSTGAGDLYHALGVARDADAEVIKKAYRKKAQKYHPDRNSDDPAAEEKFKEISAAYGVLSDPKRRKDYDEFGDAATDPNFDADKARQAFGGFGRGMGGHFSGGSPSGGFQDVGGFGNLFEDLFAGGAQRGPRQRRGADLEVSLTLDFMDAALGSEQRISVGRASPSGGRQQETLTVQIPPGVDEGARIRLAGKGSKGSAGGPNGDLYANVSVRPHPVFARDKKDLSIEAPISVSEAVTGASIEIPTLSGRVTLHVPAGTDGGTRLRLRGKGIPGRKTESPGDLYVTVRIRAPRGLSPDDTDKLDALLKDDPEEWRKDLFQ